MRANSPAVRRIPMNHEKAVNAIVKLNQKGGGYIEEKDFDRRYCPISTTKPRILKQINAALAAADARLAILAEVRRRLGIAAPRQASVSPANRFQGLANQRFAPTQTLHQRAVYALLEISVDLCMGIPEAERILPLNQAPALFRAAIKEQMAARRNPFPEETAILETALTLLEDSKGEIRTPEQEEFYAALTFKWLAEHTFRVRYAPENVTVN
jgi:hypothetical protein